MELSFVNRVEETSQEAPQEHRKEPKQRHVNEKKSIDLRNARRGDSWVMEKTEGEVESQMTARFLTWVVSGTMSDVEIQRTSGYRCGLCGL